MKRYKHTLSNTNMMTGDMGKLYPVGLIEILPGDTIQMNTSMLMRLSPLNTPVMHPVNIRLHHFFVPNRIAWDGWEDFITGGPEGNDASSPPTINTVGGRKDLGEYFGVPPVTKTGAVSRLPWIGFNKIYNEFYRDQDLQAERLEDDNTVPHVAWGKDYFTAARPWTQKGDDITLPVGTKAPVYGIGRGNQIWNAGSVEMFESGGVTRDYESHQLVRDTEPGLTRMEEDPDNEGFPGIYADLSSAAAINVNDFRKAFALQRYQEARAQYGSRYTEYLRYCGITPSDARLQRPELLGGGHARINFSEVLQTAPSDASGGPEESIGIGDLFGHGISGFRSNKFRKFFEEHGYVHTLMSVRPASLYQDGINRHFLKDSREEYFQKELQAIGQQEIWKDEIFLDETHSKADVFGYQDRYREYKEQPSIVCGDFRDVLNTWHLSRQLDQSVVLNDDFIKCEPSDRIFQVPEGDNLWCMINHHVVARRMVKRSAASRIL